MPLAPRSSTPRLLLWGFLVSLLAFSWTGTHPLLVGAFVLGVWCAARAAQRRLVVAEAEMLLREERRRD